MKRDKKLTHVHLKGFCRRCWKRFSRTIDRDQPEEYKTVIRSLLHCCTVPDPVISDSFLVVG